MEARKLVVAYCRISTLEQKKNGHGIEIQVRDATLFAQQRGLFIDRFYRDEGESGVLENRPELKRLLKDCRTARVGTVIVPTLDRLSRNVRLAENLFWTFGKHRVKVLIADMPNYNGQDRRDVLIRQIREAIAEDNRKEIIERLLKGRQERVRKGHFPGGNVPYGFRREGGQLRPEARETEVVLEILRLFQLIKSVSQVTTRLNQAGRLRRNGKPWTARQVRAILSRRALYEQGRIQYGYVAGINSELILVGKGES